MKKKIINCLCNECAGPNLEQMVGVGVGIAVAVAFYSLARQVHQWTTNRSDSVTNLAPPEQVQDSYQCS